MQAAAEGRISSADGSTTLFDEAVRDTLRRFEATGSPVITDGEQRKPSFATYPVAGLANLAPGGVTIPFEDGHTRQLPLLTSGPFRYATPGVVVPRRRPRRDDHAAQAGGHLGVGAEPAVPGRRASTGYSARQRSSTTSSTEAAEELRGIVDRGATAQIDFTEARLSLKLDPSGGLLDGVRRPQQPGPRAADRRGARQGRRAHLSRRRPGLDPQRRHRLRGAAARPVPARRRPVLRPARQRGRPRARARDPRRAGDRRPPDLRRRHRPDRRARRDAGGGRATACSRRPGSSIPTTSGTTDDCGFSPFGDDVSTSRDTAFAKIAARVEGTRIASERLGV